MVYSRGSMASNDSYHRLRERARQLFDDDPTIHCPYFAERVVLNGEGLHHLRYSAERERGKPEQMLKFRLLPLALEVIRKSGTVRRSIGRSGSQSAKRLPMACGLRRRSSTGVWSR